MKVVLDANIYLSALFSPQGICAQILRKLLEDQRYCLVLSEAICAELRDCLTRPKIVQLTKQSAFALLEWFEAITVIALHVDDTVKITKNCRDPKDEIYLSAAVASKSHFLVTGDKDLLVLNAIEQTQIINPRQFWIILESQT